MRNLMDVMNIVLIMLLVVIATLRRIVTILGNDVRNRRQMCFEIHKINEELFRIYEL